MRVLVLREFMALLLFFGGLQTLFFRAERMGMLEGLQFLARPALDLDHETAATGLGQQRMPAVPIFAGAAELHESSGTRLASRGK
jgi:hypothetical protein